MPELPEVETVRRGLEAALLGRAITRVVLRRRDICTTDHERAARPLDLLAGDRIAGLERRGKQLAIIGESGRVVVVHLGMSGQVLVGPRSSGRSARRTHVHALWETEGGTRVLFRDPRRFGGLWTLVSRAALEERWMRLGPDALKVTGEHLREAAGRSERSIKAVLLDQAVVAGVGNIYANEALFRAEILPQRPATRIRPEEWDRLAGAIRKTLAAAIKARGSTFRDYRAATGEPGSAQRLHKVYGRAGKACLRCGERLRGMRLVQRATVYCPGCQK